LRPDDRPLGETKRKYLIFWIDWHGWSGLRPQEAAVKLHRRDAEYSIGAIIIVSDGRLKLLVAQEQQSHRENVGQG